MLFDKIVAFDLETTGFSPMRHEILEVGAVAHFTRWGEMQTFSELVKVRDLTPKATEITGITADMLEGADPWKEVQERFFKWVFDKADKVLLVGHNIRAFDVPFIVANCGHADGRRWAKLPFWDTMVAHREKARPKRLKIGQPPKAPPADLLSVLKFYRLEIDGAAHRALPDAQAAYQIFLKQYAADNKGIRLALRK